MRAAVICTLILFFILFSSFTIEKIDGDNLKLLKEMLNDSANLRTSKLRFDGYYNPYDTTRSYIGAERIGPRSVDVYYLSNFFAFYKNGICLAKKGDYADEAEANRLCLYNRFSVEQNKNYSEWGAYRITKDTLEILCYRQFCRSGDVLRSYTN